MSVAAAIVLFGFALALLSYDGAADRAIYGALFSLGIAGFYELWAHGVLTGDQVWGIISGEVR